MSPTLILDCDGVLADTERDGHLVAFNAAFTEAGIASRWDEPTYARLLGIGGGKERLRALFSPANLAADPALPRSAGEQDELVRHLHSRKTQFFIDLAGSGRLPGRPGVRRVVSEALARRWAVAVASTSSERSVRAVLEAAVGADDAARFAGVFAGDVVARKKPAPDIYLLACARLGVDPREVAVVEDSGLGAEAAAAAGLAHLVTVSSFTRADSFPTAAAVVTCLGDEDEPGAVLGARMEPPPGSPVTLDDLARVAAMTGPSPNVTVR